MNRNFKKTLLMGTIWGVTELVWGYLLHLIPFPVAGAILFPVGVICMYFTWRTTGNPLSTFFTAIIAAMFKLITIFFIPAGMTHLVINPTMAILFQGIFMLIPLAAIFRLREMLHVWFFPLTILLFLFSTFMSKVAFILFQNYLNQLNGAPVLAGLDISGNSSFFFTETLLSTALIAIFMLLIKIGPLSRRIIIPAFILLSSNIYAQSSLPALYVKTIDGKEVKLTDYLKEGKPVVISFWATWCNPCIEELEAISEKFDSREEEFDFKFIAISVDDARSSSKVRSFVSGREWPFIVLLDTNQEIMKAMNISSVPFTLILDRKGVVRYSHSGYIPGDEQRIFREIKKITDEK